jgi:hypothetical protein
MDWQTGQMAGRNIIKWSNETTFLFICVFLSLLLLIVFKYCCPNKKCVCILLFWYITKCIFTETEKFLKSLQLLNKTSVQHVWVRTCVHHTVYNINSWVYLLRCVLVPRARLSSLKATGRYAPLSIPVLSSPLPFAHAVFAIISRVTVSIIVLYVSCAPDSLYQCFYLLDGSKMVTNIVVLLVFLRYFTRQEVQKFFHNYLENENDFHMPVLSTRKLNYFCCLAGYYCIRPCSEFPWIWWKAEKHLM